MVGRPASRPRRPSLRTIALGAVALALVWLVFNFLDVWLTSRSGYGSVTLADGEQRAAVVLGAAQYNGEPSPVLKARLDQAAQLYEDDQVTLVVVTGGRQPTDVTTEAKTGYDYLREQTGIPDEQLRLEVQGGSTYESLAATARFLRREDVSRVVLVTDRYHARRSLLIAEEVGLDPDLALTDRSAPLGRLVQETGAVAVGRIIGFRHLQQLL